MASSTERLREPLTKPSILVTGADGFIGSHLTEALVRRGYRTKAFVLYNSFNSWGWLDYCEEDVHGEFEVFAGDVRDPYAVKQAMTGCSRVLHLAALIGIPYSYEAPDSYVDTNVRGTLNILQAARELGAERVVTTSTSEVYGSARFVPITEQHPLQGQSPYSATKIAADQMAYAFSRSFGLPVTVLRPFNTYGPRQSARAIIPTIISQIAAGQKQIRLGALTPTRDFLYVNDTVAGFLAAMESDAAIGETVHIGSGFEVAMGDLANEIIQMMGGGVEVVCDEERVRPAQSEVERLCADASKAGDLMNWAPALQGMEGLREGLRRTIDWFLCQSNRQCYKEYLYNK